MCVFSIDISFKGSQSHSNMRSKVTAVSYLHRGVIDTAVQIWHPRVSGVCGELFDEKTEVENLVSGSL
jgi:hypothetical protein